MDKPLYLHEKIKKLPDNQPILQGRYNYLQALIEPYKYTYIDKKGKKTKVTVRKGFLIDGASIPRTFWRLIGSPFTPMFSAAAVVHDYLYKTKKLPRKLADQMFKAILRENTVSKAKSSVMYAAVRTGGFFAWRKKD